MTKEEKNEIINGVVKAIKEHNEQETPEQKRERIMRIKDARERQKAIKENLGLFAGKILIGGLRYDED